MCRFGTRLTLSSDPALKETAESAYFANIQRIQQLDTDAFTSEEEEIAREWTKSFVPPTWADVAWGNGQVAQSLPSTSWMRKIARHEAIPKTRYFQRQVFRDPDDHQWFGVPRPVPIGPPEYVKGIPAVGTPHGDVANRIPHGALQFVPKSYKTYRSICMEDLSLVPYQQATFRAMDRWFRSTLSSRIDLQDQSRSRAMAMVGSKHPSTYATIDLSMASDSVSEALVRKWLWRTPLRDCLYATRSSVATYNDSEFELPMFAAMGSACCFPLECLVFALMCEATVRSIDGPSMAGHAKWYVYGDDIVIETAYAPALIERLQRNGFIVNLEKSYVDPDSHFREACGGEYYAGEDVTPVRISRNFCDIPSFETDLQTINPRALSSWYRLANAFWQQGLWFSRKYLLHELVKRVPRGLLPWTNDESSILQTAGSHAYRQVLRRGQVEYTVLDREEGFGDSCSSSAIFTLAPVTYSCWDSDYQCAYNLVVGSVVKRERYYSIRGHLGCTLTGATHEFDSWHGDCSSYTSLVRQYKA